MESCIAGSHPSGQDIYLFLWIPSLSSRQQRRKPRRSYILNIAWSWSPKWQQQKSSQRFLVSCFVFSCLGWRIGIRSRSWVKSGNVRWDRRADFLRLCIKGFVLRKMGGERENLSPVKCFLLRLDFMMGAAHPWKSWRHFMTFDWWRDNPEIYWCWLKSHSCWYYLIET
jgi:hypothetical protein